MIHGITINDIFDPKLESKLKQLSGPRKTARVVIDYTKNIEDAIPVVQMAGTYVDVMIQIQDSFGEKSVSDQVLYDKAGMLFKTFQYKCKLWEIGNEINGEWCSPNVVERVKTIWAMMPQDHKAAVTLFLQPDMMDWYAKNPIKTDYIFISFYPHNQHDLTKLNFESFTKEICEINPNALVGIGEYGSEEWDSDMPMSWRQRHSFRRQVESISVDGPKWVGGYFYWDGQQEGF